VYAHPGLRADLMVAPKSTHTYGNCANITLYWDRGVKRKRRLVSARG